MEAFWLQHDNAARALIRRWRGREVGRSDGFLAVFEDIGDAVGYAMGYHDVLNELPVKLATRIGIHLGPIRWRMNDRVDQMAGATRYEVDGIAVPIAARVMSVARPGQTLLSSSAAANVHDVALISHGHWRFKGLDGELELFETHPDAARSGEAPVDGDKAYRVVRDGDMWRPVRDTRHTLPIERDAFVGRKSDCMQLMERLRVGHRLVSVVGAGGMGKTRLAVHAAKSHLGEFPGGVWFCDLAQASTIDGIFFAVAQGLGVPLGKSDPVNHLSTAIRSRGVCMIVLDNFEQVARHARQTLGAWLDDLPEAVFVVTSRERLGLTGESVIWLQPLDVEEATDLFVRRAAAVAGVKNLVSVEESVIRLVKMLDCLPLAIELAAARTAVLSVDGLVARLGKRFDLLVASKGRVDRQSTLQAAIDWSWDLLPPTERSVLAQLSTFAGSFSLSAAEAVARLDQGAGVNILDAVQALVDQSLLRRVASDRFDLLVSIREYADAKLRSSALLKDVELRHGAWFSTLRLAFCAEDVQEIENIMAAARRAIERGDAGVVVGASKNAWLVLRARGPYRAILDVFESASKLDVLSDAQRVQLLDLNARCLVMCGQLARARSLFGAALEGAERCGATSVEISARSGLAELDAAEGRIVEAREGHERAVSQADCMSDDALKCAALNGHGTFLTRVGDHAQARRVFERVLGIAQSINDRGWQGAAMSNLGQVAANVGDRAGALSWYEHSLSTSRELRDRVVEANLLCNLGLLYLEDRAVTKAQQMLELALQRARDVGLSLTESVVLCNLGLLHQAEARSDQALQAYRGAREIAARLADHRTFAQIGGYLGTLLCDTGALNEARAMLREAMDGLREVGDSVSYGIVLCQSAVRHGLWAPGEASRYLIEAERIANHQEVNAQSEFGIALQDARAALSLVNSA